MVYGIRISEFYIYCLHLHPSNGKTAQRKINANHVEDKNVSRNGKKIMKRGFQFIMCNNKFGEKILNSNTHLEAFFECY